MESKPILYSENWSSQVDTRSGINSQGLLDRLEGPRIHPSTTAFFELRALLHPQTPIDAAIIPVTSETPYLNKDTLVWIYYISAVKGLSPNGIFTTYTITHTYNETPILDCNLDYQELSPYAPSTESLLIARKMGMQLANYSPECVVENGIFHSLSHKGNLHYTLETLGFPTLVTSSIAERQLVEDHALQTLSEKKAWIARGNISTAGFATAVLFPKDINSSNLKQKVANTVNQFPDGVIAQEFHPFNHSPSLAIAIVNGQLIPKWGSLQTLKDPPNGNVSFVGNRIISIEQLAQQFPSFFKQSMMLTEYWIKTHGIKNFILGLDGHLSNIDGQERIVECNARRLAPDSLKSLAEAEQPTVQRDRYHLTGFRNLKASSGIFQLNHPNTISTGIILEHLASKNLLLCQDALFKPKNCSQDKFSGITLLLPYNKQDKSIHWAAITDEQDKLTELCARLDSCFTGLINGSRINVPEWRDEVFQWIAKQ
jgi:hypothetical protein